ncbi:MAG: hypothetical protein CMH53_00960 [Myxococcales bacterium]|nr:hypothetical protein [Myxococcales bacterium]
MVQDGQSGEFYAGQISCNSGLCNGPAASIPSGGKKLGDTCVNSNDCDSPLFCQPVSGNNSVCSQQCNPQQSGSCPTGFTCYGYQGSSTQGACIKTQGGGGNTATKKKIGETCSSSTECESQLCVGGGGQGTCEKLCTSDAQCSQNQQCSKFSGKNYGACVSTPQSSGKKDNGQPCSDSTQCKSSICVGSGTQGTCLADCTTTPCPAKTNCVALSGGLKGCVPAGPKGLGESCQSGFDCSTNICAPASGKYICSQLCGAGNPACPSGYSCTSINQNTSVCLPSASGSKKGNGDTCQDSSECASGLCIGSGNSGTCLQPCTTNQQCPAGYGCASLQSGGGACIKLGDKKIGEPCNQASQCASGACYNLGKGNVCTDQCQSSVDCPCGFECDSFQGGAKLCVAGAKLACLSNGEQCATDAECKSDLCLQGKCVESCSIYAGSKACTDPSKGCIRLQAGQPKGVCAQKGPEGYGAVCTDDTNCVSLFCNAGTCGEPCNPFGPNTCSFKLVCSVADGNVGACLPSSSGGGSNTNVDAGSNQPVDAGGATTDVGVTNDTSAVSGNDVAIGGTKPTGEQGSDSGGLCSANPTGDPAPTAWLVLLATVAVVLRRRRVGGTE